MIVQVYPSKLNGVIDAPASKSSMQRACAAALLAKGTSTILKPGKSNDDLAALDVIQKLGAKVTYNPDGSINVTSNGVKPVTNEINCGESGLGIRMFTPIAALSDQPITIIGSGSLLNRPMDFFDQIFPALHINIKSNSGKLPLQIQGPLQPVEVTVDGSLSSQFLTGLLMAYGAAATHPVTIKVTNLKSKPYIDLTIQVMHAFGVTITHTNHELFTIDPTEVSYVPQTYTVEGDWSGGAFLLVAGAIAGPLTVKGLDVQSTQADKAILQALIDCGADIKVTDDGIEIGPADLKAFHFNATDCPDLFPPLVALATYCQGVTVIEGVHRLAHKESDRGLTLQQEFAKMGVEITLQDNVMLIKGGEEVHAAPVHSRHDHRIAMACGVAALRSNGVVNIEQAQAIDKSYPDFFDHLQQLGAQVFISF
ncbi:MAG: 3-phosphoshikimate 1-carboxyvinyltransferase [Chitinophagaceae bacterium]|nr:3-phosphoshikimate 1-carboxyvinyltransferase [Chitinophagaceae bacterium]